MISYHSQYLQFQPGRRLPTHSIHSRASESFCTVGSKASWSETDETLQVLQNESRVQHINDEGMRMKEPNYLL